MSLRPGPDLPGWTGELERRDVSALFRLVPVDVKAS